jgi:hypothetical protein
MVLRKIFGRKMETLRGGWRNSNELRRTRFVVRGRCTGEMKSIYKIFVRKSEGSM